MDHQVEADLVGHAVPESDHLPELPRGVDVEERERDPAGVERLAGQVQQDRRVLADGVKHHWSLKLGHYLAEDVDALGLKLAEVG